MFGSGSPRWSQRTEGSSNSKREKEDNAATQRDKYVHAHCQKLAAPWNSIRIHIRVVATPQARCEFRRSTDNSHCTKTDESVLNQELRDYRKDSDRSVGSFDPTRPKTTHNVPIVSAWCAQTWSFRHSQVYTHQTSSLKAFFRVTWKNLCCQCCHSWSHWLRKMMVCVFGDRIPRKDKWCRGRWQLRL